MQISVNLSESTAQQLMQALPLTDERNAFIENLLRQHLAHAPNLSINMPSTKQHQNTYHLNTKATAETDSQQILSRLGITPLSKNDSKVTDNLVNQIRDEEGI